jgi:hypothetical protein
MARFLIGVRPIVSSIPAISSIGFPLQFEVLLLSSQSIGGASCSSVIVNRWSEAS